MTKPSARALSRREREVMDILYRRGRATAAEVLAEVTGDPSSSTVRTLLRILERKGFVRREAAGLRYIYLPAIARQSARRSALRHLIDTFYDGSVENVVGALLGGDGASVTDAEFDRIAKLVEKAKREGRR
jgi:BlaI family penicillinase repressor